MSVQTADKSWSHLYPPFRKLLREVLDETARKLGETWLLAEGYRSQERQTWLYAAGRTREGPMVTWVRSPTWHGTGLAADCIPKEKGFAAPKTWWLQYRAIYERAGLENPAWENADYSHVQLTDAKLRAEALAWVRAGFQDPIPEPTPVLSVIVDGEPVPDAAPYLEEGRAWVKLRPITDGLDLVIGNVLARGKAKVALVRDDAHEWPVPIVIREGVGFARAADLPALVRWEGKAKVLYVERRGD